MNSVNYLRISITDRCNLNCIYCNPAKIKTTILSYEAILNIIKVFVSKSITKIRVTGGEPLYRKNIIYFLEKLKEFNSIVDFSITTNGSLLSNYVKALKQLGYRINISLNTLDKTKYERITGSTSFPDVWAGIEKAINEQIIPLKINMVVMKNINDDEILDFAKLTINRPLIVRFIELMPFSGIRFFRNHFLSNKYVKKKCEQLGELIPTNSIKGSGPALYFTYKNATGRIGFISHISEPFCQACNKLRLSARGEIIPCLFYNKNIASIGG